AVESELRKELATLPDEPSSELKSVSACSRRGDARFFLRDYQGAVDDYKRMVELDESLDASHWRLGIALFMANQPDDAAAQFDRYHAFDNVDRENGIWRYLSHCRASGRERAARELLKYEKDDRPPFAEVYRLFDGSMSVQQVQDAIPKGLAPSDRLAREFYTDLYVGFYELVCDHPEAARNALQKAVTNTWPRNAGFGPRYMWHVARVQYIDLISTVAARNRNTSGESAASDRASQTPSNSSP
ncbi:MAG: hypothetical protein KDA96_22585, partial [Planctomycetaceae bacterium]|nr:hypothetical protein [Planctomycetaceae bacterium]